MNYRRRGMGSAPIVLQPGESSVPACGWGQILQNGQCVRTVQDTALAMFSLPAQVLQKVAPSVLGSDDMGIGGLVVSAGVWLGVALWAFSGGPRRYGR